MNFSFYIFGTPNTVSEHDQYPLDFNSELFKYFARHCQGNSQFTVYRSGKLIYYVYIRNLAGEGKYFGICLVFNSVCCREMQTFFNVFQEIIVETAKQGKILQYKKNGEITSNTQQFYHKPTEIEHLHNLFRQKIDDNRYLFVPFDRLFKLNDNAFQTISTISNVPIENEGRELSRYLEQKKRKKKKTGFVVGIVMSLVLIAVLLFLTIPLGECKDISIPDMETFCYRGKMKNGLPNGNGSANYANGDFYEGDFINGLRNGNGKFFYTNGDIYTGAFANGLRHGKGEMVKADQSRYDGHYVDDKAEGEGKMYDSNGVLSYDGTWKNDIPHGRGKLYDEQGKLIYNGEWENGNMKK